MEWRDFDLRLHELTETVMTGMKEWRLQHPRATFREIETELDQRLACVRARLLEDAALLSRAAELEEGEGEAPLSCPACGTAMQPRGKQTRELTTQHDQTIHLERQYAVCPQCGKGFFPPR